jgi:hypothetical protein
VIEYFPAGRVAGLTTHADEPEIRVKIEDQVAGAGVSCEIHMPHAAAGKVARRIAELAEELGSDVIIIGTRGHSAAAASEPRPHEVDQFPVVHPRLHRAARPRRRGHAPAAGARPVGRARAAGACTE